MATDEAEVKARRDAERADNIAANRKGDIVTLARQLFVAKLAALECDIGSPRGGSPDYAKAARGSVEAARAFYAAADEGGKDGGK